LALVQLRIASVVAAMFWQWTWFLQGLKHGSGSTWCTGYSGTAQKDWTVVQWLLRRTSAALQRIASVSFRHICPACTRHSGLAASVIWGTGRRASGKGARGQQHAACARSGVQGVPAYGCLQQPVASREIRPTPAATLSVLFRRALAACVSVMFVSNHC